MANVRMQSIYKQFGKTEVIHGVDLEIEDNEFVVFVGPSGCGKSTFLRCINRKGTRLVLSLLLIHLQIWQLK